MEILVLAMWDTHLQIAPISISHLHSKLVRYVVYFIFQGNNDSLSPIKWTPIFLFYHSPQSSRTAAAPILIPSATGSKSSYSSSSHSERSTQQAAAPVLIPVAGGESERYTSRSERVTERKTAPAAIVPVVYPSVESQRYTSRAEHLSEDNAGTSIPLRIQVRPSSQSNRYVSQVAETHDSPAYIPVVSYPADSTASERYQSRAERVSAQRIPIQVHAYPQYPATEQSERYASARSERVSSNNAAPVAVAPYYPSTESKLYTDDSEQSSRQMGTVYPVYTYPAGSRSRYVSEHKTEQETTGAAPQPIMIQPAQSATSRYTASQQSSRSQSVAQPQYVPVVAPSSTQSRYVAQSDLYKSSNQNGIGGGGAAYVPIPYRGTSSRYYDQQQAALESDLGQVAQVSGYDAIGTGVGGRSSTRLGSNVYNANSGLSHFMSESERLAKLQSQTVRGEGSALVGSAILETEDDRNAGYNRNNLDSQVDTNYAAGNNGGAFKKTKSWESSSKWSSGTQYDDAGKLKSYGSLSTAESEHHNLNGHQTGYKAATTTLDDDGKISTYSIHTP